MLAFCSSSLIVLAEINKLVSSANNWMFSPGTEFGRSLTYKRNKTMGVRISERIVES